MNDLIEQQREHFNSISEKYFKSRSHPNHLLLKELIWEKFLGRNSAIKSSIHTVLEPMCGMAEGYSIICNHLKADIEYFGFDYSEQMVEIAKTENKNLHIEWGDVTIFKNISEPYDLIILIGGLHHVYLKTEDVLKNLNQSLRDGGYFISFEPTHNNFISRKIRNKIYNSNALFDQETEQGYEFTDLSDHFRNTGFKLVDQVYPGLSAYILYYNPDAFPLINVGGKSLVKFFFWIDRLFWGNYIGRKLSFGTLSLWQKIGSNA